jgi:photosystem II stability/assembly factor-like uncharacterized protein
MKHPKIISLAVLGALALLGQGCAGGGADGGAFRSSDAGETWEAKSFVGQEGRKVATIAGVNGEKLIFDPQNPDVLFLGTKENGLYKSDSKGEQWRQLPLTPDRIRDVAVDPTDSNFVYTVRQNTVIKSSDAGESWEIAYTDSQQAIVTRLAIDWFDTDRIFATTSIGTVLLSEDRGANWRVIYQVDEPITGIMISPDDSRVIYLLELDEAIHKTTDGGKTWLNLFEENEEFERGEFRNARKVKQMAVDPTDGDVVYVSSDEGLIKTMDGGVTWAYLDTLIARGADQNRDIRAITVDPQQPATIYFAVGKILHKSVDAGATWRTIETFPSARRITTLAIDPTDSAVLFASVEAVEDEGGGFFGPPKR